MLTRRWLKNGIKVTEHVLWSETKTVLVSVERATVSGR